MKKGGIMEMIMKVKTKNDKQTFDGIERGKTNPSQFDFAL